MVAKFLDTDMADGRYKTGQLTSPENSTVAPVGVSQATPPGMTVAKVRALLAQKIAGGTPKHWKAGRLEIINRTL